MTFLEIFLIAVGLAMDAFAVSLGTGALQHVKGPRPVFRISFHFGLFQFMMPIIGWLLGIHIAHLVTAVDHWIAFLLLAFIGGKMIYAGIHSDHHEIKRNDPSRGISLILLSIATSIDALAVGFSMALLNVAIWYPSVVIGIVAAAFSLLGMLTGRTLGKKFGNAMEIFGGLVLVFIGGRILVMHLFLEQLF